MKRMRFRRSAAITGCAALLASLTLQVSTTPLSALSVAPDLLGLQVSQAGSTTPVGYTPTQILAHYNIDTVGDDADGNPITGTGQTIGVVLWGNNNYATNDLQAFITGFKLGPMLGLDGTSCTLSAYGAEPCFQVVNAGGSVPHVATPSDDAETALDIEWSHAIAPGANIMLVQAQTFLGAGGSWNPTPASLDQAIQTAVTDGADVVSMSWGLSTMNATDTATWDQLDSAFVSGDGDFGYPETTYPGPDASVLDVGGTTFTSTSESAWVDTGGGVTKVTRPGYQLNWTTGKYRVTNDVAYNAANYPIELQYSASPPLWYTVSGVSAGIPQWAGIITLADQLRTSNDKDDLDGPGVMDGLYLAAGQNEQQTDVINPSYFKDITAGCAYKLTAFGKAPPGPCYAYPTKGYDPLTGLGVPNVANLVDYLGYDL